MDTVFSPVSPQDIGSFAALYTEVFNAPPWQDGWSVPVAAERLRAMAAAPRFEALGAYQAGERVGLVLGNGERWVKGWVLHLREMFVASGLQRGGIGRKLLAEFERSMAGSYEAVYLQTGSRIPAHKFYAGCGYASIDLVSMRKRIEV